MRLKIKNNPVIVLALLCLLGLVVFAPQSAHAYTFEEPALYDPVTKEVCPGLGLTHRIMPCIKENIIAAVNAFLVPFSSFYAGVVAKLITFAVAMWGVAMVTGKASAPGRDATILLVKIGAVLMFSWNFNGWFGLLLDAMEEMLDIVTGYVLSSTSFENSPYCIFDPSNTPVLNVWNHIDCALEVLVGGIFSPFSLSAGIVGFLLACFFSGTVGFFVGLIVTYLIFLMLYAIARSLYIFVSAYIAFAIMILLSPVFVPLILFRYTKPIFEKWVKLTAGFMIQPVIIFAYLGMLLAAFDTIVYDGPYSLYRTVAGNSVDDPNFSMGPWLLSNGVFAPKGVAGQAMVIDPRKALMTLGLENDPLKTGTLGNLAGIGPTLDKYWRSTMANPQGIFSYMGIGGGATPNFIKVDWPVNSIDWAWLAFQSDNIDVGEYSNYLMGDDTVVTPYLVKLFMSALMAVVSAYIFMLIPNYLPYISAGISGKPIGMPTFGTGSLSMPGTKLKDSFSSRMGGLFTGTGVP